MGEPETRLITGTEEGRNPFFSYDGQWLGFFTKNEMKKVHINEGEPVTLCSVAISSLGASWGSDNTIIFSPSHETGLFRISADSESQKNYKEVSEQITFPDINKGEQGHVWPQILDGGKIVLYIIYPEGSEDLDKYVAAELLETHERELFRLEGSRYARYVPTGHLVYARGKSLFAVTFDLNQIEVTGNPEKVVKREVYARSEYIVHFTLSDNGTLVYVPEVAEPESLYTLVWLDRDRNEKPLPLVPQKLIEFPRLSANGKQIACKVPEGIALLGIEDNYLQILTQEEGMATRPVWHTDSKRIAYTFFGEGIPRGLFWKDRPGLGNSRALTKNEYISLLPDSWSPDGKVLAFTALKRENGFQNDIWLLSLDEQTEVPWFHTKDYNETEAKFSPDGNWIVYTSNESDSNDIYVRPFFDPGSNKIRISQGGGFDPVWSLSSKEIFYRSNKTLMAVSYRIEPQFKPGNQIKLFDWDFVENNSRSYDVSPDGKFLVVKRKHVLVHTELKWLSNWFNK